MLDDRRAAAGRVMNDDFIVTVYVVLDETMRALGHRSHPLARVGDAAVLTIAVVAAGYSGSNQERALQVIRLGRYLAGSLSTSRCTRRLHALADWLGLILATLGALFADGAAYLLDSMPIPACRRARARRCRTLRGRP